jgi:pheromone shutdown protein TraB
LTFVDPQTKCKILLVGVTHGSEVSAQLAKETIEKYKPSALVLELCQDRYLSMCVESKIPPIGNQTLSNLYKMQLQRYEDRRQKRSTATKIGDPFQNVLGTFRFAIGQGIVGGYVVIMGTFLSSLQRLFSKNNGDEFIAAMKTSQELKIPIRYSAIAIPIRM